MRRNPMPLAVLAAASMLLNTRQPPRCRSRTTVSLCLPNFTRCRWYPAPIGVGTTRALANPPWSNVHLACSSSINHDSLLMNQFLDLILPPLGASGQDHPAPWITAAAHRGQAPDGRTGAVTHLAKILSIENLGSKDSGRWPRKSRRCAPPSAGLSYLSAALQDRRALLLGYVKNGVVTQDGSRDTSRPAASAFGSRLLTEPPRRF